MSKGGRHLRRRKQRGAAMAEFAIIALVLFMCFFALIDIGIAEIGNSSTGNAAREGARVASIHPVGADDNGTNSNTAVKSAVNARLAGLARNVTVTVTCLNPTGTTTIDCDAAAADYDLVRVTVSYHFKSTSPFLRSGARTRSATMLITGSSAASSASTTTTSPSTRCTINSASFNPSSVVIAGSSTYGSLTTNVTVTVRTVGSCSFMFFFVTFPPTTPGGSSTNHAAFLSGNDGHDVFTYTIGANDYNDWTTGEMMFQFWDFAGHIEGSDTPLRVSSPNVCSIVSAAVSPPSNNPPSVTLASSTEPAALASGSAITVTATGTAACGNVYAAFTPGDAASAQSALMTKSGTTYTYSIAAGTFSTWTAGLKLFTFTDGASPPSGYAGPTTSVQVNAPPPACNVSVGFTNTSGASIATVTVSKSGNEADLNMAFNVNVSPTGTCSLPIYARWDRGKGFSGAVGQAALNSNTYQLPVGEGGNKAWSKSGQVTFRFYNGVPGAANQLAPLTPVALNISCTTGC